MNIYFLTQEEPFYLPIFFNNFFANKPAGINVTGASIYPPFNSAKGWGDVIKSHLLFYGFFVFFIQSFSFLFYKIFNILSNFIKLQRPYSVASVFRTQKVEIIKSEGINSDEFLSKLRKLNIDLIISVACPKILKKPLIQLAPKGVINFHAGYLPKYRGINPLFWSMLHGEKKTAISIHFINESIDDGDIISQQEVPIDPKDSLDSMYKKIVQVGPECLIKAINDIKHNTLKVIPNDSAQATYFGFPQYEDGKKFRSIGHRFR